jgi:hypothetical protein
MVAMVTCVCVGVLSTCFVHVRAHVVVVVCLFVGVFVVMYKCVHQTEASWLQKCNQILLLCL